ncbi:ion transporter [Pseudovibrio sp. Tun.PSC04-5.I4]|uniref:ion transporter n=1 Tax=Pseudovibrio sp. Tun.PSC04-5.I4 TaxID=1798213 RepID=UPI00088B1964|nr:ion transporter [Pseudovibrio sp. Tun.PSC04-5.I4]SDQ87583.1 voltage-gated potassium channel [Pseudovibrio sp. Tun.PSC04-5.I4]
MMKKTNKSKSHLFDVFVLILSVYVLTALLIQESMALDSETVLLLVYADTLVCGIFLIDFFVRLMKSESKAEFMKWGWIDLISSIPLIGPFRYGRIIRLIRIFRALRASRTIARSLFNSQTNSMLTLVFISSILMIILAAIAILQAEKGVGGANILNLKDAIWWSFVTITTVGYGDFYPVSFEGRIIASFVMTIGVGLFASLTGAIVANFFLKGDEAHDPREFTLLLEKIDGLHAEIIELKHEIQLQKDSIDS